MKLSAVLDVVAMLIGIQSKLSNKDRLGVWEMLQTGYCKYCGRKLEENERCHCNNDE